LTPAADFRELLTLDEVGTDRFAASVPGEGGHLFGGLTFALAMSATLRTVADDRELYAATCQFIGGGRGGLVLAIEVDRVRDGRKLSLRRTRLLAGDRLLFTCDSWFAPEGIDADWQPEVTMGDPDDARAFDPTYGIPIDPLEVRTERSPADEAGLRIHPVWARSREHLGDDRHLHVAALAFLSDTYTIGLMNPPDLPEDAPMSGYSISLNHNLWVHRQPCLDEWVRVDGGLASLHGQRALSTGSMHTADGTLIATFAQEAMHRD